MSNNTWGTLWLVAITAIFGLMAWYLPDDANMPDTANWSEKAPVTRAETATSRPSIRCITQKFTVTAYCPCEICCGRFSDGITASGHVIRPGEGFVAADKRFPFGTLFLIPGYHGSSGVIVLDRGGAIKGNRLDVFFDTHYKALQWGKQELNVTYWLRVKAEMEQN